MNTFYAEKANNNLSSKGYEFFTQINYEKQICAHLHIHTAVELLFFCEGEFKIATGNEEHTVRGGDAVLFRSNELHRVYSLTPRGRYYVIKFSPAFIMELAGTQHGPSYLLCLSLRRGRANVLTRQQCDTIGLTAAVERLVSEAQQTDNCTELGIKIFISQILLIMLRYVRSQQTDLSDNGNDIQFTHSLYETIAFIEQNYALDICVDECARRANVSYSYFSRKFKAITGKSFKQYLTDVRLDHAEKELCSTDKPITQIATECGFNSTAYFSAVYKRRSGDTPSSVRVAMTDEG